MTSRKLQALRNLAERPGTEAEGEVARKMLAQFEAKGEAVADEAEDDLLFDMEASMAEFRRRVSNFQTRPARGTGMFKEWVVYAEETPPQAGFGFKCDPPLDADWESLVSMLNSYGMDIKRRKVGDPISVKMPPRFTK